MKFLRFSFVCLLFLIACSSPTAVTPPPPATREAPPDTAVPSPTHTATAEPLAEPTAAPTLAAETATPEPTPTAVPPATFTTPRDIQASLTLQTDQPVIEREVGNKYLNGGAIIFHDGQFHAFTNFFNSWPGETVTYYYTSSDGTEWTRNPDEPLFTVGDVPLEGRGALILSGLVQPDGTWVLYYHTFTSSGQPGAIGRATAVSPTGPWQFDRQPVLSPGSEGAWDDLQVMRVNVLPTESGYVMYYAGVNRQSESRIGMALSADGIVWEKYDDPATTEAPYAESDPILEPFFEWEGSWLGRPEVVKTNDGWVMLYEGSGGSQTGLAISQDGINFERYEANPILTRENMVEGYTFFQGALFHQEDTYFYLIEAGNGRVGTDIFLYTIDGSLLSSEANDEDETVSPTGDLIFDFTLQRGRDNPALEDGSGWEAAWTFAPGVIYHNNQFHMFYTGWSHSRNIRIGYAISDNGLDFERVSDEFVLEYAPDEPTVGIWTPVPHVTEDGTWILYVGKNENQRLTNEVLRATAANPEGPWTWDETPIYAADEAGWDAKLLPESMARTPEGGFIMAYESNWCSDTEIGLLFSEDGETWQAHNDPATGNGRYQFSDPILSPSNVEEDWDRQALSSPLIFATDDGYELFYIGQYNNIGNTMSKFRYSWMGYATSADGINWERYEANPVIELTGERGCPWMSGVKVDDTYYLYMALSQGSVGIGVITGTIEPNSQ